MHRLDVEDNQVSRLILATVPADTCTSRRRPGALAPKARGELGGNLGGARLRTVEAGPAVRARHEAEGAVLRAHGAQRHPRRVDRQGAVGAARAVPAGAGK